eukprot:6576098-Alexandrium_andersonii.AAC.1
MRCRQLPETTSGQEPVELAASHEARRKQVPLGGALLAESVWMGIWSIRQGPHNDDCNRPEMNLMSTQ